MIKIILYVFKSYTNDIIDKLKINDKELYKQFNYF